MPSDLIRAWLPVRVKKTRQGKRPEHDPDPKGRVCAKLVPVFPRDKRQAFARRSCSNKRLERNDDSKKSHLAPVDWLLSRKGVDHPKTSSQSSPLIGSPIVLRISPMATNVSTARMASPIIIALPQISLGPDCRDRANAFRAQMVLMRLEV